MEDIISSSINFEDFESTASNVRTKIQTYFSQLIEVIKQRQTKLISELDEIISHYKLERDKIKELEEMQKFLGDRYAASNIKDVQSDFFSRIQTELAGVNTHRKIIVQFEWNRKYAKEASEIGKLRHINPQDNIPQFNVPTLVSYPQPNVPDPYNPLQPYGPNRYNPRQTDVPDPYNPLQIDYPNRYSPRQTDVPDPYNPRQTDVPDPYNPLQIDYPNRYSPRQTDVPDPYSPRQTDVPDPYSPRQTDVPDPYKPLFPFK